jgi:hypothetical protein
MLPMPINLLLILDDNFKNLSFRQMGSGSKNSMDILQVKCKPKHNLAANFA